MILLNYVNRLLGLYQVKIKYHFSPDVSPEIQSRVVDVLGQWEFGDDSELMDIEPLNGGLNNVNLILKDRKNKWVLKIRPDNYQQFGADHVSSIDAQTASSRVKLAPKIIFSDASHILSEFLEGVTLRSEYVRKHNMIKEIAGTIKALHHVNCELKARSFFDDIRLFMVGANKTNIGLPDGFGQLLKKAYELEKIFNTINAPKAFCHNDLVPQNFIQCDDGIRLVDFDYAGFGWIAADLASASSQFEMTEDEIEFFLKCYDERLDDGQRARHSTLKYCNNIREIAFTLFAEPLLTSTTSTFDDLNYASHRAFNMKQAEMVISDPAFSEKCKVAESVGPDALF